MEYRVLGKTGVKVSCLCLGTLTFGNESDEAACAAIFHRCRDAGINFFDTANAYNGGRAEEILGKLIQECRDEIILSSKVYFPTGKDINARGLSRRHIFQAIEGSLKRLRTDRIDLYFLHNYDREASMEEPLRAMDDLVRQGKILYPAVSNWMAWQTAKGLGICQREGWAQIVCLQPMYNLTKRTAEIELLPLAEAERIGAMAPESTACVSGPTARWAAGFSAENIPRAQSRRRGASPKIRFTPDDTATRSISRSPGDSPLMPGSGVSIPRPWPWPGCFPIRPLPLQSSGLAVRISSRIRLGLWRSE